MLKKLLKLNRDYQDAKQQAVEHTVNVVESKTDPLYFFCSSSLTIFVWLIAAFILDGFERLYNSFGFYPIIIFFIISYFSIFLGSKFIFKPTTEELSDDTSIFALFSACGRKEMRSLISIGFALLHTLIFVFYLVNKDLKWL